MKITFEIDGTKYEQFDVAQAREIGAPSEVIGRAIKEAQAVEMRAMADSYRGQISKASANKLAEYRIKESIAKNKSSASKEELALLTREAKARGLSLDELLAGITKQAAKFRQAALLVAALEAEGLAAIEIIQDDDADVESKSAQIIVAAKQQAEAAYEGLA